MAGCPAQPAPRPHAHGTGPVLDLGGRRYDLTHRALVMGILNRTPDSFYDKGATYALDSLFARAEALVADGADILDVGGVKAGPGPEVTEPEELERVVPVVTGLVERFDMPVSVDTWRASVARSLMPKAQPWATTSAGSPIPTTCRQRRRPAPPWWRPTSAWLPGWPTPTRTTTMWWPRWPASWANGPKCPSRRYAPERIVLDAGLDLGKTAAQSLTLLRASSTWPASDTRSCSRPRTKPSWA